MGQLILRVIVRDSNNPNIKISIDVFIMSFLFLLTHTQDVAPQGLVMVGGGGGGGGGGREKGGGLIFDKSF